MDYIKENYDKIKFHDQDALNGALFDKTLHVMPQWNMTSAVYVYQLDRRGDRINGQLINGYTLEIANAKKYLKDPVILHFVSRPKPWQRGCIHPLCYLYYEYAKKTIYFNSVTMPSPWCRKCLVVKHFIKERLSALKQVIVKTDKTRY